MATKPRKSTQDLLMPGAAGWERWTAPAGGVCTRVTEFGPGMAGVFGKEMMTRLLALPLGHVWVLPAWLQGAEAHLRDMAALHLERLGLTVTDLPNGLQVRPVAQRDGAFLVCMTALKEGHAPLWDTGQLADEVLLSADCLPLPVDAIVIYRELGKLVLVITNGSEMVYASPLSSHDLDEHALGEVNHLCLQLAFQGVLGQVQNIILWLEEEGNLDQIKTVTGLPALRMPRPAPLMPKLARSTLVPPEILKAREQAARSARTRMLALTAGFAVAAAVAVMAVLIAMATQERDLLRERVAELTPAASQVLDHKRSWLEAAPAVDPAHFPMQVLLECQVPKAAGEVSMTHFEWQPDRVLLRGRTPSPSLALQYAQEIQAVDGLMFYTWETPAPTIASDNSATFELKGGVKP